MRTLIRPSVLTMLLGSCLLSACLQDDPIPATSSTQAATTPAPDAESLVDAPTVSTDDPCKLLTDAEVREAFPGTASGKREHGLDEHGIMTCLWDTPSDRFVVQTFKSGSGSVEEELRSRLAGSVDPLMAGAADRVRYETIAGVGDQTMLVVEKADPQHGILADTAVLVTQRAGRKAVLFSGRSLTSGDRASALKTLETLGRSVAKRL